MNFFPKINKSREGFNQTLQESLAEGRRGFDLEFNEQGKCTVVGISSTKSCAALFYDPNILRDALEAPVLSGHYVTDADKPITEGMIGRETSLAKWSDTGIKHYLCNANFCSAPQKTEDADDTSALGYMNLWAMASLYTRLPQWKFCRNEACSGPCPRHDILSYCAVDSYAGLMSDYALEEEMTKRHIPYKLYADLQRLTVYCSKMTKQGVKIDRQMVRRLEDDFEKRKQSLFPHEIRKKNQRCFGYWSEPNEDGEIIWIPASFSPNSPKQVLSYFNSCGIDIKGRGGKASTSKIDVQKALNRIVSKRGYEFDSKLLAVVDKEGNDVYSTLSPLEQELANLLLYKCSGKGLKSWFDDRYIDENNLAHPRFIVTGTSTGRLASSNPNCFDSETEVLTRNGWKYIRDLAPEEEVMQYEENGYLSFVRPIALTSRIYNGVMVNVNNQHITLRVTEDHRCLLKNRKTGEHRVFLAKDYKEDWQQLNAALYTNSEKLNLSDDEIRFLVAFQADGTWAHYDKKYRELDFSFVKIRKIQRFLQICADLDVFTRLINTKDGKKTRINIVDEDLILLTDKFLGKEKLFTQDFILKMNAAQLKVFFDELFYWDGCYTTTNCYATEHKINAECAQLAATLLGIRAYIYEYQQPNGRINYQVYFTRKNYSLTTNAQITKETVSNERVYCLSVPSSYILIRRNDKTMITGQCQNLPRVGFGSLVRRVLVPRSSHLCWIKADYSGLEYRICFWYADIKRNADQLFEYLVNESQGLFKEAAAIRNLSERDVAKSIVHAGNYLEGITVLSDADLRKERTQREIEKGALYLYDGCDGRFNWEYRGGYVAFTGANLADRLFGDRSLESRRRALAVQEVYFSKFPEIREWHQSISKKVEAYKEIHSATGRTIELYGSPEDDLKLAAAFLGQGGGADYCQEAMLRFSSMDEIATLQIHDELAFEKPADWSDLQCLSFMSTMSETSERLVGFKCPIKVSRGLRYREDKTGKELEDLHEIKVK